MPRTLLLFAATAVPAAVSTTSSGGVTDCGAGAIAPTRTGGTLAQCKAGCQAYAGPGAPCLFIRWGYTGPNGKTECVLKNGRNAGCNGCGPDGHCAHTAGCVPGKKWGEAGTTGRSCTYNMPVATTVPPAVSPPPVAPHSLSFVQDCDGGNIFIPTQAQAPTPEACLLACKNYRGNMGPCRYVTFGLNPVPPAGPGGSRCVLKNGRTGTGACNTCAADGSCARTAPCFLPVTPSGNPNGDWCSWNLA